ncbi:MAG: hypothetical protein ACK5SF_02575 [Hyphomonadaceae bacterium]|jgi:hypothetical protein
MVAPKMSLRWDLALLALALACFSAGFWRMWPGAAGLDEAPLGPVFLKAGIASMGLVGFAVRWEVLAPLLLRRLDGLLLVAVCLCSAAWALAPAIALQHGILLLLVWVFGIAVAARLSAVDLAFTAAFAGLFALLAQLIAARGLMPLAALDGDLTLALCGALWASAASATWRWAWLAWAVALIALALGLGDLVSLMAAGVGIVTAGLGYGLRWISARRPWTPIDIAVTLACSILTVTLLALFTPLALSSDSFGAINWIGYGFGVAGSSISEGFGQGLGMLGLGLAGLWAIVTSVRLALDRRATDTDGALLFGLWCAGLATLLLAPTEVSVLGPWVALLAGLSFGVGMCPLVPAQRPSPAAPVRAGAQVRGTYPTAPMPAPPRPETRNRLT